MEVKNKMAAGKLLPLIISMSLPPIFSMLVQSLYNIVDSIFVAKISNEALTAVSVAFPIQNLILALSVGFGTGMNALIARKLGNQEQSSAQQAARQGLVMSLVHYLLVVFLGVLCAKPFMALFTDSSEVVSLGWQYIAIVIVFSFGQGVQITIEKILQACGNMIAPMFFQLIGAVTNLILDPLLIFGWFGLPALGIRGAAIATVIGQIFAMLAALFAMFAQRQQLTISFRKFSWDWGMLQEIYLTSLPSFLMLSIGSVMVSGINLILKSFSQLAVAAFGIYYKLQSFVFMPISGLVQGTLPIMSYNYGGKNKQRLLATLKISLQLAVLFAAGGLLLFWLLPGQILQLFNGDPVLATIGTKMLRIISLSFVFGAVSYVFASYFQATGSHLFSLLVTLLRQLLLVLPLAFILSRLWSESGVWWAFVVAEGTTALLGCLLFKYDHGRKRIYREKTTAKRLSKAKGAEPEAAENAE